jgi:hypothetical protein
VVDWSGGEGTGEIRFKTCVQHCCCNSLDSNRPHSYHESMGSLADRQATSPSGPGGSARGIVQNHSARNHMQAPGGSPDGSLQSSTTNMRLWTVQPLVVWEQFQHRALLQVDESRRSTPDYVPHSYRWLVEQLKQRIPAYPGTLPWWAYCEKPDLRWVRHCRPAGQREVRLELEPCPDSFLTFPSWAWDDVYCGHYLSFEREEHDEWMGEMRQAVPDEDGWPLPEPWRTQLEASWLRLFDRDLPSHSWDHEAISEPGSRQAVLGVLRLEEVRQVTHFVGCSK